MNALNNRNAIITGASRGIGVHIAHALAAAGVNLILGARDTDQLAEVAHELRTTGANVTPLQLDVTDERSRRRFLQEALHAHPELDILINNAGIEDVMHFERQAPDFIERTVDTNLVGPMLLTHALLPHLIERGRGNIVNISSLSGRSGMPYGSVYAGTKAGLAEWSLSLRAELIDRGIIVSAVVPGFVSNTGIFARKGRPPPALLGSVTPEAVAAAVVRAIKTGSAELLVSGKPVRPLLLLKVFSPHAVYRLARRAGIIGFLRSIAEGNRADRGPGP